MVAETRTPAKKFHQFELMYPELETSFISMTDAQRVADVTQKVFRLRMWPTWNAELRSYDVICEESLTRNEVVEMRHFIHGVTAATLMPSARRNRR